MTDHSARPHARFGASSAHRWFACPGSVRACEGVPDVPGPAALEGTRAHELLESMLMHMHWLDQGESRQTIREESRWEQKIREIDASVDMQNAVNIAYDYVCGVLDDHPDAVMLVEHRFEIPVASAPGEVFGTNDVCIFVPSLRLLYVIDYKHGAGTYVEVKGNKQLRFYALGALASRKPERVRCEKCEGKGSYWDGHRAFEMDCKVCNRKGFVEKEQHIDTVAMAIIQPRCTWAEPIREDWVPVEDVLAFGKDIGEAIARCKAPDAPLVPGEEQCRFCAVRTTCPARQKVLVDDSFGGVQAVTLNQMPVPGQMTPERIVELMAIKDQAAAFFKDVEDEARRRLEAGDAVPGLKLVEAQARRQWVDENVDAMAHRLADIAAEHGSCNSDVVAMFKADKLRTLTEVEALLKVKGDRTETRRRLDAMAFLTTKKSSGALKVVAESDPRPAVNRADAAFGGVQQIPHIAD